MAAPNPITERIQSIKTVLQRVYILSGTLNMEELKAFITQSTHNASRTLEFVDPSSGYRARYKFRVTAVDGVDHLFLEECLESYRDIILRFLTSIAYPIRFIPPEILVDLTTQENKYVYLTADVRSWINNGLPIPIKNSLVPILDSALKWVDLDVLFHAAETLQTLRGWTQVLKLNNKAPPPGPRNLVLTYAAGIRESRGAQLSNTSIERQLEIIMDILRPPVIELPPPTMPPEEVEARAERAFNYYTGLMQSYNNIRNARIYGGPVTPFNQSFNPETGNPRALEGGKKNKRRNKSRRFRRS